MTPRSVVFAVAVLVAPLASAQTEGRWLDTFAYPGVRAVSDAIYDVEPDGAGGYYVAGAFESIDGDAIRAIAHWNGSEWRALGRGLGQPTTNRVHVLDLLLASDGALYATGTFQVAYQQTGAAVSAMGVVRWKNGRWESLGGGLRHYSSGAIGYRLAEAADGSVLVTGEFTSAVQPSGVSMPVSAAARWTPDGWEDLGFTEGYGRALAVHPDGRIALAGNGLRHPEIADPYPALVLYDGVSWTTIRSTNDWFDVTAMVWRGEDLFVGGDFHWYDLGAGFQRAARWDGAAWHALGGGLSERVGDIALDEEGVVFGGQFRLAFQDTDASYIQSEGLVRWTGSRWEPLADVLPVAFDGTVYTRGAVHALAFGPDGLVVGGDFDGVRSGDERAIASGLARLRDGRWEPVSTYTGAGALGWQEDLDANPQVRALVESPCGEGVIAAGTFEGAGSVHAGGIALWTGAAWEAFGGGLRQDSYSYEGAANVTSVALAGCEDGRPRLYVAGRVTHAIQPDGAEIEVDGVAYWDGTRWSNVPGLGNGYVGALAYVGGELYAGGTIWDAVGPIGVVKRTAEGVWEPLGRGAEGSVRALLPDGEGGVFVAGDFEVIRQPSGLGIVVNGLARWTGDEWMWIGGPAEYPAYSSDRGVVALALGPDGALYAAGGFETFLQPNRPQTPARRLARWAEGEWTDAGDPGAVPMSIAALPDGRLVVGTSSERYGTRPENHLFVREEGTWGPFGGVDGSVFTLATIGDRLYLGGEFSVAGGLPSPHLAAYDVGLATPTEPSHGAPEAGALAIAPNPARGTTTFRFALEAPGSVHLGVYDALGREIAVLHDGPLSPGDHAIPFGTLTLPPGVYVARFVAPGASASRTFTVER